MVNTGRKPPQDVFGASYYLQRQGKFVYLCDGEGGAVATCKLQSVAGRDFKKIIKERTGISDEESDRITAGFLLKHQKRGNKKEEDKKEDPTSFDEETLNRAWQLVRDPQFFWKIGKVFEYGFVVSKLNRPRFIFGEERHKRLVGPLLIGAAKLGMASIIKLLGEPGTAKDSIMRMWLDILPLKSIERSYFTAAALRYSQNMKNADLLYIPDSPELRGEMGRQLRFMRSDDGGLASEYAMKDQETGEMTTKLVELPIKAVATTSNSITGDPALESGMWTLTTNGSKELTDNVKKEKLKLRAGNRLLFPEDELKVVKCAFHLLLTEEIPDSLPHVPYAENLFGLLESARSESRRNPDKLCDLISLVAWLRRFQKPEEQRDEADLADLYISLQLGLDAFSSTISELNIKEQKIFNSVKTKESASCRDVADNTKIAYKSCYRILDKLIEKGYVNKDKVSGKNFYSILTENTPNAFLISEGGNENPSEKQIEQILGSFEGFSLSHGGLTASCLFDPVTGNKLFLSLSEEGKLQVIVENNELVYPYEKVRSVERGMKRASEQENKPNTLLPQQIRNENRLIPKKEASVGEFTVDSCFPSGQFPVCFSCHKPIVQLESLTNIDGKPIHKNCKAEIEAQKKRKEWRCPQLAALDGRPFCNVIQSFLAKPIDCKPDCSLLQEAP